MPAARTSAQSLYTTAGVLLGEVEGEAVGVLVDGVLVDGVLVVGALVDGAGVLGAGVLLVDVLGAGVWAVVLGPVVVGPVVVGPVVVEPVVVEPVVVGKVVLGPEVVEPVVVGPVVLGPAVELLDPGPPGLGVVPSGLVGPVHGGALGVTVGLHGETGCIGRPTGSDGRVVDLDVPCDRSTGGPAELPVCAPDVSRDPDGTRNQAPRTAIATAATAPSFRTGGRRRLCRARNFCACRPRWNCLTSYPSAPRPRGILPTRTLQSKLTVSA